jgi:single-strand DNA-binding protein
MNALRNKVQLIGRLGQDPEIRTLESGKKVAHFNLATNESYRNSEGTKIDETTWHSIVAWNGLAELTSKYLSKGKEVCIEGRISYRSYTDKNGLQKNITEIVATDLVMLGQGGKSRGLIGDEPGEEMAGETDTCQALEASDNGAAAHRAGRPRVK